MKKSAAASLLYHLLHLFQPQVTYWNCFDLMGGRKDCCGSRIGTSFDAERWLSLDPSGLGGVSISTSVHLFAYFVIVSHLIEGSLFATAVFLLLYTPCVLLALSSLYMAWSTDPGSVPMGARPLVTVKRAQSGESSDSSSRRNRAIRRCHKCNDNFKPLRAHHDSVTGRCIVKFDHFCPWVGNAVGALNHKFFVLFVFYTMLSCLLALFLMLLRAIHCGSAETDDDDSTDSAQAAFSDIGMSGNSSGTEDPNRFLTANSIQAECAGWHESMSILILLIVSFIFLIFTCCMLFEQIDAIETNASKIARMKMRVGQAGTELSRVTEEFNEMFGGESNEVTWHWFWPSQVEFPRGMKKVVLGYEWDETFDAIPYEEPSRDEEEGLNGKIEMTRTSERELEPPLSNSISSPIDDGQEGSFSGAPVIGDQSILTKRANSRGPDGRKKASSGTLT